MAVRVQHDLSSPQPHAQISGAMGLDNHLKAKRSGPIHAVVHKYLLY
jgi:hypothetical protein